MFFRQILHEDLGCASYVVADGGEAAVVDPKWEIEEYLELADEHGFRIAHILETHNHADHLSGRGRLAKATGATIHVSKEAGVEYEHEPLADGDYVAMGEAKIVALATPGHRPEHMAYVVEDTSRSGVPWLVLTGDSLFIGDLARPDLGVDAEEGARGIFRSLHRLLALEDFTEVWPGHIGGSLCGGAGMSEKPGSTIGFERRFNRYLRIDDEGEFVRELTRALAPQPPNFKRIVALNRGPLLADASPLEAFTPQRVSELMEAGAALIDGREPREYDAVHVPGSLNVTMVKAAVSTRAAWVVGSGARRGCRGGERRGRPPPRTHAGGGRLPARARLPRRRDRGLARGRAREPDDGYPRRACARGAPPARRGHPPRRPREGRMGGGTRPGSLHIPYHELADGFPDELRTAGKPVAVVCSAGNRSSLAASLLRRAGLDNVQHVTDGGVAELRAEGSELVQGE